VTTWEDDPVVLVTPSQPPQITNPQQFTQWTESDDENYDDLDIDQADGETKLNDTWNKETVGKYTNQWSDNPNSSGHLEFDFCGPYGDLNTPSDLEEDSYIKTKLDPEWDDSNRDFPVADLISI